MILFNLQCRKDHLFEAWFRDNATYERQVASGEVLCPFCGSRKVEKAVMAPRVAKKGGVEPGSAAPARSDAKQDLHTAIERLRQHVESNCDYVGGDFPEEARKIHYGETEARGIYGEASNEEAKELTEEGIEFARLPMRTRQNS